MICSIETSSSGICDYWEDLGKTCIQSSPHGSPFCCLSDSFILIIKLRTKHGSKDEVRVLLVDSGGQKLALDAYCNQFSIQGVSKGNGYLFCVNVQVVIALGFTDDGIVFIDVFF